MQQPAKDPRTRPASSTHVKYNGTIILEKVSESFTLGRDDDPA
jgi:hypothetical protein